jgi:hypothetical protein
LGWTAQRPDEYDRQPAALVSRVSRFLGISLPPRRPNIFQVPKIHASLIQNAGTKCRITAFGGPMETSASSPCSCRFGGLMSTLKLGAQPRPGKRRFHLIGALLLFLASSVLCESVIADDSEMELISAVVVGCLAAVTFALGTLTGIVGAFGCDDCVSRL